MFGKKHSEKSKIKMGLQSKKLVGKLNPMFGVPRTVEHKNHLRKMNKGKKHKEETKQKISKAMLGENNPFYGQHHTQYTKNKMGKSKTKTVIKYDLKTGKRIYGYSSLKEAQASIGKGNVGDCCRDKQKSAGGFGWKYLID
jgi:hypothetical protein